MACSVRALIVLFVFMKSSALSINSGRVDKVLRASFLIKELCGHTPPRKATMIIVSSRSPTEIFAQLNQAIKSLRDSFYP
jgi:hypothetical protein